MLESLKSFFIYMLIVIPVGIITGYILEKLSIRKRRNEKERFLDAYMDELEKKIIELSMSLIIIVANLCIAIIAKTATNLWVAIFANLITQKNTNVREIKNEFNRI